MSEGAYDSLYEALKPDTASSTPLYLQLRSRLRQAVEGGLLRVGEAIPGERHLAKAAGVSRVTVRRALDDLVADGVLVQRQGAGTFIAPRIEQPLAWLTSFSEDMRVRGLRPASIWLERTLDRATPDEAMALDLSPGAWVVRIARVRIAGDQPMAVERACVPARFLPAVDLVKGSLYEALAARGHRPVRALQRVRAEQVGGDDARLLSIAEGNAVLAIERRAFLADGTAVEFTRSRYRGDLYDFVAELRSEQDGGDLAEMG